MSDDPKKKKKRGKKSKNPQKILEDAMKAGSSAPDDKGSPTAASVAAAGDVSPPPSSQPRGYEEYVSPQSPASPEDKAEAATGEGHTYNEITFHQPGEGEAVQGGAATGHAYNEVTDPQLGSGKNVDADRRSMSATYEHPSPVNLAPAPSQGYMTLNALKEEKSVYDNPDVGRARKMLGSVTRRLTSLGRSESGAGLVGSSPASSKSHAVNWSLLLVVASLVLAFLAILLSIVALGLSTAKCNSCKNTQEVPNPIQAQPTLNCTYNLKKSCSFMSGLDSDPGRFCETTPTPVNGTAPIVRSLGCVISTSLTDPEDTFVATLLDRPAGHSCQCYQTGNSTAEVDVRCSMTVVSCFLV